jgi:hypothetical protein
MQILFVNNGGTPASAQERCVISTAAAVEAIFRGSAGIAGSAAGADTGAGAVLNTITNTLASLSQGGGQEGCVCPDGVSKVTDAEIGKFNVRAERNHR